MTDPFSRYSDRARKVMALAKDQAQTWNHECIETGAILIGIVEEGRGVALGALHKLGIDPNVVRREVEKLTQIRSQRVHSQEMIFSPRAKKVLSEFAEDEANRMGHNYIGTEHLLLGLMRQEDSTSARVLSRLGLRIDAVREAIREYLHADVPAPLTRKTEPTALTEIEMLRRRIHDIGHQKDEAVAGGTFERARALQRELAQCQQELRALEESEEGQFQHLITLLRTSTSPKAAPLRRCLILMLRGEIDELGVTFGAIELCLRNCSKDSANWKTLSEKIHSILQE